MTWKTQGVRVFKTAYFSKAARKAGISDDVLARAAMDLMDGKGCDLTGGVWKKRLLENRYRGIVVAKAGQHWFFVYLFAKKDEANITACELAGFHDLAEDYAKLKAVPFEKMLADRKLLEILNDDNDKEAEI